MEQSEQEIGQYVLVKTLGSGTTGKVKLAINRETKQEVAIKVIKKTTSKSPSQNSKRNCINALSRASTFIKTC